MQYSDFYIEKNGGSVSETGRKFKHEIEPVRSGRWVTESS